MHHATIFDLDDTIIDSGTAWDRTCAAFTQRHGHQWRPEDTATLQGNGGWPAFIAGLCAGQTTPAEVAQTCTTAMIDEFASGRVQPLAGAVDLVVEASRRGRVGLASASPRRFVLAVLDGLGISRHFDALVCGEDVAQGKPAPDPYLRAADALGVHPSACLAVEDSANGIISASTAGMHTLAIPRRGHPLPAEVADLASAQASNAVDALPVLARLLDQRLTPTGEVR